MIAATEKNERKSERIFLSLPIRVEAHENQNKVWREVTHLESVSDIGAGFYTSRIFDVGQLVFLSMPIEKEFRRYDHDKENYGVWGIIRHCHRIVRGQNAINHIGVAFIGQEPPYSYRKNPATIYKVNEIKENGFWQICEDEQPLSNRKQSRYPIPIEVYIAVYDSDENIIAHEQTVTENISTNGASVFSGLQLNVGDTVKVIKQHGGFTVDAIVRNQRVGEDNLPRLHLEFVNVRFPLEGID
jgi:PilZ domain